MRDSDIVYNRGDTRPLRGYVGDKWDTLSGDHLVEQRYKLVDALP